MPTTLFVQQQHAAPLGLGGEDCEVHYLHHSHALYIITEHDYDRSLIPSAKRATLAKATPARAPLRRIQTQLREEDQRKAPRPLMATTLTYPRLHDASMAIGGPPGSPPDLTNSKSSKSSSFHSSTLSDVMGPSDLSHFEDISLDDVKGALGPSTFPMPSPPSTRVLFDAPRRASANDRSIMPPPPLPATAHPGRELTPGSKPRYPSLKGQVNGAVRQQSQLNAPHKSMRRGFTSPSAPSLANSPSLAAPGRRSRSPSPSQTKAFPPAPRSLSRRSSKNLDISPSSSMSGRRQSWQHPVRKTAKEREAECDDEDDEVPEEYSMWNVPISPRPVQERSPAPSTAGSPPQQVTPSPAASRPTSQRSDASSLKISPISLSRKVSGPSPPNSANKENAPPQPLTRQRTNTWEDTYMGLDEDGKKLTEALEEFQTDLEREQEVKRQQPTLSRSSSLEQKSSVPKKALPPVRKSDPLIDPFQPSAEKEKHLSRTRPSWLPPKDPREEKKHLKEWAKMQTRIAEATRMQQQKEEAEQLAREQAGRKKADLWQNTLLPKYATEIATPAGKQHYRQLWWSGTPPMVRGAVWKTAIGNDLGVSAATFNVALKKGIEEMNTLGSDAFGGKAPAIVDNCKMVFPDLKMFAPGSETSEEQPLHMDLVNVCLAYTSYRPDVDTLAGIHHIIGLFLLNMSQSDTFICLCNLLNRALPLSFLVNDTAQMTAAYDTTLSALSKKAPSLAKHLADLRVEPRYYLQPMFTTILCDRLPVEHAARLMDVYAIEGDKIATRAAVGFLTVHEGKLYQGGAEDVVRNLNTKEVRLHPDDFMATVYEAGKIA
ncbi:hypothetical protein K491DRAFT_605649 [Lophiostoma macrostomum CBS 122681]|uniref:Rab-GAP TBC domain-containing protein n=1 Tax=Lophiostoma macrostomum CBS 122681 TaxID=1314788 RepID=A0A6A6SZP3_9PLEO|nr:hypothetical protein K491DRAFT_605649 [Lophiostoma macrostomum CBS 122681]